MAPRVFWLIGIAAAACGGKTAGTADPHEPMSKMDSMMMEGEHMGADDASAYGPLDVGADWSGYAKVNKASFPSETHGGRMVDVYVNPVGVDAYEAGTAMPVGSVVVKTSHDTDGSEGPVFVMEKRAAGFDAEHGDWYFAIHWAAPSGKWKQRIPNPIYWRTPSPKAAYCSDCHDGYDDHDGLGGVPEAARAW